MSDGVKSLSERLNEGFVLVGEGYLFELERRGFMKAGPFVPDVAMKYPGALAELHREFMRAGSDVMVALTYYAHRAKMEEAGLGGQLEDVNRRAVQLAKEAANTGGALTAGNICNTWDFDPSDVEGSGKRVRAMFEEQVRWAAEEGVDLVIGETFSHLGEAMIALEVIKEAGLPAVITCIPLHEKSCDGYAWDEVCHVLEGHGADVVGLNCGRGPATMLPILDKVRARVKGPAAALPVPFRTSNEEPNFHALKLPDGNRGFPVAMDPFVLTRYEMADFAVKAREMGIDYLGVCCGGAPHHLRAMAEALGRTVPGSAYSPDMTLHPALGSRDRIRKHYEACFFGPPAPKSDE